MMDDWRRCYKVVISSKYVAGNEDFDIVGKKYSCSWKGKRLGASTNIESPQSHAEYLREEVDGWGNEPHCNTSTVN